MSIKKEYLKTKCKATFTLPKDAAASAKNVNIVGDFNEWDETLTPMKKQKDGTFTVTLSLEKGREYQYRYLIDGATWENDWCADKYVPSTLSGTDNSVVVIENQ